MGERGSKYVTPMRSQETVKAVPFGSVLLATIGGSLNLAALSTSMGAQTMPVEYRIMKATYRPEGEERAATKTKKTKKQTKALPLR
jgi:hypothetical protein